MKTMKPAGHLVFPATARHFRGAAKWLPVLSLDTLPKMGMRQRCERADLGGICLCKVGFTPDI